MKTNANLKLIVALMLLNSHVAYAYIDPSSMILGIQGIIAAVVSVVVWLVKPVTKIKKIIKSIFKKNA